MSVALSKVPQSEAGLGAFRKHQPSSGSWIGLCAASFFLAEANGVTAPFVNTYLLDRGWGYDAIGGLMALAALISWMTSLPAGFLIDRIYRRRSLLAAASLTVGCCYGLLPAAAWSAAGVAILLAIGAVPKQLFGPLTNALALDLAGHAGMDRAVGIKEGWNHTGNIAAAVAAIVLTSWFPVSSVFLAVAVASTLAALSLAVMADKDLIRNGGDVLSAPAATSGFRFVDLLADRRVLALLVCSVLFHLANAPIMPLVAQKVHHCGGSNAQVAAVVLVAQAVMIPVAVLAGFLGRSWGRSRLLAVGFAVLPVRIVLYALTDSPAVLVGLQALDGIGAGIFDVAAISICADVTRGQGRFNALGGVLAAAVGLGGVVGPLASGLIVQNWGFETAFTAFAAVASVAAILYVAWMPSARPTGDESQLGIIPGTNVAFDAE